jgi:uncharacterized protein (DUF305 family)
MKKTLRLAALSILISAAFSPPRAQSQDVLAKGDADWSELLASMDTMHAAVTAVERSGNPDVDFVRLMVPHHRAAVDMARVQLLHGKDPQMRRLAQEIIADQQSEIELMSLWLAAHAPETVKGRHGKGSP